MFKPKNEQIDANLKNFFTVTFGQIFSIEVIAERVVEVLTKDQRQLKFGFPNAQDAKEVRESLRNTCFYDHLNPP